ncbi:hypothetical protein [Fibrella arboris]|uniref:hypothetical protein n=1 Tax=Fibrella arboris TaxID=3242486 RepID=UPI0035226AD1
MKKYPSLKTDLQRLAESLLLQPTQGDSLGEDCYKIRLLIKSKRTGKAGGGRVITTVRVVAQKIYLLALYDKSEVASLSDDKITERLKQISE